MRTSSLLLAAIPAVAHTPDFTTSEAGNPFVDGLYADPDTEFYQGQYWVYPTSSRDYDQQTYLDAFSSPDLVHWTKHANVLVAADFSWARRAVWAPAPVARNGKYYLYFSANDIQTNTEQGGIGVGIADQPAGPYKDALGKPLIGQFVHGAQPIDQDVFVDDDGQAYIYYGGHGHANVAKLKPDMVTMDAFPDGARFREITPANYVEGPQMLKRNGTYYLFWSEGGWGGPDYAVAYAMSPSPTGPFVRRATILQQDAAVASGSGHNAVIHVPNSDIYYIVYHRHPLGHEVRANDRHLAYDRLYFNADGTIRPVRMLVRDNFDDGAMLAWTTYGGAWDASTNALRAASSAGGKALLNTNFSDVDFSADVVIPSASDGDAGLVFRASNPAAGPHAFDGYYAGISTAGTLVLGMARGGVWTQLACVRAVIVPGRTYRVRVTAGEAAISVYAGDETAAQLHVRHGAFASGMTGVRVFGTDAVFDNVRVDHLSY